MEFELNVKTGQFDFLGFNGIDENEINGNSVEFQWNVVSGQVEFLGFNGIDEIDANTDRTCDEVVGNEPVAPDDEVIELAVADETGKLSNTVALI